MIRFYNGKILSFDGDTEIRSGEVWVEGDRIYYVGDAPLERVPFAREIDLKGNLLMPGFKDAHTHSAMTFLRSFADDMPLHEWLFMQVFPMEAQLTADHIYHLTKLAILEYLSSGITASFDMYFQPEAYIAANTESGFRTVLCGAVSGGQEAAERLEADFNRFNGVHPLISYKLGFHAEYTAEPELLAEIGALARKYKAPVFTHNSETKFEVEGSIERHGKTPTELFESLGIYDYGGGGFHTVHMSPRDLEIFKEKGLWAVTNPGSNAKLASGIAPITKMLNMGINLAVGTDGPASNNALDMFREMYLVTVLQKLAGNDAAACPADEVLKMAVTGGAGAMGLNDCDVIAAGKQADLIVIDLNEPNMQPLNNIVKNIVYSVYKKNVKLTMIAGKNL